MEPRTLPLVPGVLPGAEVVALASGWDSDAFAVDGRIVVKLPKHAAARARLRREAALLALVRPSVTLPVPDLHLVEGTEMFSWHEMLPGEHLSPDQYARLPEVARDRLGRDLGRFLAQLHRIGVQKAEAAGAVVLDPWRAASQVLALAGPVLPAALTLRAERLVGVGCVDAL